MKRALAVFILLAALLVPLSLEVSQQLFWIEAKPRDNVTLRCAASGFDQRLLYWFKFQFGYKIQLISKTSGGEPTLEDEFKASRFFPTQDGKEHFLTIRNVSKEDQATYFCQAGSSYNMGFINGSLLIVKDPIPKKIFDDMEKRQSVELVMEGNTVDLQCSVISKTKENPEECASEHQVYWYKATSESDPQIIHTSGSKCDVQEKRCDYHLAKTIQKSSDSGLYSCAVLSCGEILFGEGTQVEIGGKLCWDVITLVILLTVSVFVNVILILAIMKTLVCVQHRGQASSQAEQDQPAEGQEANLDNEETGVNYVALEFSRKTTRLRNNTELLDDCIYSNMREDLF
ncbi:Ig kappa chain V-V region HP R16.7 [Oryzias melastigma]|uniref:Ig kappa chain V-V region HP R16.7 n=1 Tax=Oryzias melastigma TaxID=30732 RepID=A0A834C615_ORYME|nr:Ig kappa chain V-V region HP R16.7 [Oryzias melastigma]